MAVDLTDLPDYTTTRVWDTDFSNPTTDAANFNIVNYVYVTDAATSTPAVQMDNTLLGGGPFLLSSITTKAVVVDCDVAIRFRAVNGNTLAGQQGGRGCPMPGMYKGGKPWVAGSSYGDGVDYSAFWRGWVGSFGDPLHGVTPPVLPFTDGAQRWIRVQLFGDAMRYKIWRESDSESADWAYCTRVGNGWSGTDWGGGAGLFAWVLDASFISHLTVTELVRSTPNLLHNTSYAVLDTATGYPLWWSPGTVGAAASATFETIGDQDGHPRRCLKVVSSPVGGASDGGGLWQQGIYNSANPGPNSQSSIARPTPQSPSFPPLALVTVWSKGAGLTEPDGGNNLASAYVNYYYDVDGNLQSYNARVDHHYYEALGPTTRAIAAGGLSGGGTWDWHKTQYVMDYITALRLFTSSVSVGVHDSTASGAIWIGDVSITPYDPTAPGLTTEPAAALTSEQAAQLAAVAGALDGLATKADIPPVFVAGASSALAVPGPLCTPTKPFPIKRGDTLEPLTIRLYNVAAGGGLTPLQLPDGTTAVFNLRSTSTGQVVLSRVSATVTSGDGDTEPATLTHLWEAGETDVADDYEAEFECLLPGGYKQSFPTSGFLRVTVFDDIA